MNQPSVSTDEYLLIAELYDHVVPYRDRPDVEFFIDVARRMGGPVLELGCGTGRVLIPVAREGTEIVGIDLSQSMLAICAKRLQAEPPAVQSRIQIVHADMRTFSLPDRFKLVTMPFRGFQHLLTVEDQLACLDCVRRHLVKGGQIILDVFNPSLEHLVSRPLGQEFGEEPEFLTPDGRRVIRRHRVTAHDRFNQVTSFELTYAVTHPDGHAERVVHAFQLRYLFRFEAEHLLARSGFAIEHVYAGYDRSVYGSTYPGELVFVARRT